MSSYRKNLVLGTLLYAGVGLASSQGKPLASYRGQIQYFIPESHNHLAVVNLGHQQGFQEGMIFNTFRKIEGTQVPDQVMAPTGKAKVVKLFEGYSIVEVEALNQNHNPMLGKFSGVMASDEVILAQAYIAPQKLLSPDLIFTFRDLFKDPAQQPESLELSQEGQERLRELLQPFLEKKVSYLFIKGFTDSEGDSASNMLESQQRATTVQRYLIQELGFDTNRVIAMGFGEDSIADESNTFEASDRNRRIVISAATNPSL